jgi:trehalose-6-phosphate hydrolase
MLATALHGLQGTPYIYQGEEIGMANPGFADIADYRDVETHNAYRELRAAGLDETETMAAIRQKSRDNSRTPMQWDDGRFAGFSRREPWIGLAPDAATVNVAAARRDPDSVLQHYRRLIALRKRYPVFSDGDYRCLTPDDPALWVYARASVDEKLLVISNFSAEERDYSPPAEYLAPDHVWQLLCANYADAATHPARARLRPYESLLYRAVLN